MRAWSPRAGAPAVPAALALAAGILLGVALPEAPPAAALALLVGLGLTLSILSVARGAGAAATRVGACVAFAAAGIWTGRSELLAPRAAAVEAVRSLPDGAVVEVVGRLRSPWSAAGPHRRAELDVESAFLGRDALAISGSIDLAVGGARDAESAAAHGDRVRVRGPLRLPDVPREAGTARTPLPLPPRPVLWLKSAEQIDVLDGPSGAAAPLRLLHRALAARLAENARSLDDGGRRSVALLSALFLGETSELPRETASAFRDGGVAHVLSISGLHVALLAALLHRALGRSSLGLAARDALALAAVLAFAVFVGGRPPVARAALMIGLYLAARLLGRPTAPAQVVGAAALVLLLLDPADLFDLGFLLTFAAVYGLAAFGAPLSAALESRGVFRPLARTVGATLGAELAILPIQLSVFHVVPFVALVSNLVVVPLAGLFLVAGVVLAPALVLSPEAAAAAVAPLRLLADGMTAALDLLDRLGAVRFVPAPSLAAVVGLAALLALAGLLRARWRAAALAGALGVALVLVARPPTLAEPGTARLDGIDVGQGDAWLVTSPEGSVLIDGGGGVEAGSDVGRSRLLPRLAAVGATSFEAVVASHPHPDHTRGLLAVLAVAPVGRLVLPDGARRNEFLDELLSAAARRGVRVERLGRGTSFEAAGIRFEVLHPGPFRSPRARENNGSLVLRASLAGRSALFSGDVERLGEEDLVAAGLPLSADILKVPHHGSRTSTSPEFLARVGPRVALIGVGRRNRFGHPAPEVVERLDGAGARVFRTDRDGDLSLLVAGRAILPSVGRRARGGT